MAQKQVSQSTMRRLPIYLMYLKSLSPNAPTHISSAAIAAALGAGEIQVRKDLAAVSDCGRPRRGYPVDALIADITAFLGYNERRDAVVVGCGKLGAALLSYSGFHEYGIRLVAGFDTDPALADEYAVHPIFPLDKLEPICREHAVQVAILAVPAAEAQAACDRLTAAGIRAVLNLAPAHLDVPDGVVVQQVDLAALLAQLSGRLFEQMTPVNQEKEN